MNWIFSSTQQVGMAMIANSSLEERLAAVEAAIALIFTESELWSSSACVPDPPPIRL
ncbi:hypothetical protein [Pantanalinema sp. GBBB05]|uniref:hypothetical protein n=1 Tax=Pantanalinema sp. GBBB05 TaxID=2604139 RepID=UPI003D817C56